MMVVIIAMTMKLNICYTISVKNKKPPNLASGDFQPKPYHN